MEPLASKASFSSSDDSDFNDDSDVDDTDDVSMHINGWTSGAKANLKSSQFVIGHDGEEKFQRRNSFRQRQVREANADVMNQIDKVMTDINFNEQNDTIKNDDSGGAEAEAGLGVGDARNSSSDVEKSTNPYFEKHSRRPSFHELTGTASSLDARPKPRSKLKPKNKSSVGASALSKMKQMSILGRKNLKKSSTSRKSFQALPQSPDDHDEENGSEHKEENEDESDDESNILDQDNQGPKSSQIRRPKFTKPKNVDDIANKYFFSSKKAKKFNPSSEEDFEAIVASSNAILNGSVHPSISIGEDYNGDDYIQNNSNNSTDENETVVFNYDEELHDFVPAKRTVNTSSYMKQWWKNRPSSNSKPNKNIRKMVRFSSDLHMYGASEEDLDEMHRRNRNAHNLTSSEMQDGNHRILKEERRAAISYLVYVLLMSIIYLIGISYWNPATHKEIGRYGTDTPPELDYDADSEETYHIPEFEVNSEDESEISSVDGNNPDQENIGLHVNTPFEPVIQSQRPTVPTITNTAPTLSPIDNPTDNGDPLTREDVFHIIQKISSRESMLQNGSAQNMAGTWVAESYASDMTQVRILQRYILATLYFALNGEAKWKSTDGWLSQKHECDWFGISCSMDAGLNPINVKEGNIISGLDLNENGLTGGVPQEIGYFDELKSLSLSNNDISGKIPYTILRMNTLVQLHLNGNLMTGEIPKDIGMLENLESLDLSTNMLAGKIPNGIGNMEGLADLRLSNNQLTGEFPLEILDLTRLREMLLDNNQVDGEIPRLIGNLGSLLILNLSKNDFYGPIPDEIGQLSNLRELYLGECIFTGSIPRTIKDLTQLRKLDLSKNDLNSEIPAEIGVLEGLGELNECEQYAMSDILH